MYVESNPLLYSDPQGLAKWGGKTPTRLANCPAGSPEKVQCQAQCANRGGIKSCKVTRSTRPIIEDGYPTREPYTLPNSMNCVCNEDDGGDGPKSCPSGSSTGDKIGKAAAGVGATYLIYRGMRMVPSLFPPLWPTIPANAVAP